MAEIVEIEGDMLKNIRHLKQFPLTLRRIGILDPDNYFWTIRECADCLRRYIGRPR